MDKFLPVPTNQDSALPGDQNFNVIAKVEQTLARLDEYTEISDLTELHRQARGLVEYLRGHDENGRTMRAAQLRIERRIGEVLSETVRPGNPQLSQSPTNGLLPKGITRDQSSKWQQLAKLPADVFEKYLGDARKPSLNGALKHALRAAGSDEAGETALYCGFGRREVSGWVVWGNEVESDKFHKGVGEVLDAEQVET